jgi:ABC-type sugar transport system substrate-binding protein
MNYRKCKRRIKTMKKLLGFIVALVLLTSTLAGCSSKGSTGETAGNSTKDTPTQEAGADAVDQATDETAGGDYKIGLSLWGYDNQYWVELREGAQKRCDELGAELVVADPNNVVSQQVADVENFITMGVDAIILAAIDPQSVEAVAKQARDAGIKVIAQSIQIEQCDVYSSADEYGMGYVVGQGAGQWIVDNYGADAAIEFAVLNYDSNSSCIPRGDGLQEGILSIAPNAKLVARQDASTVADGQKVTDSLLQANPNLQVIVCQNDSIALGALSSVQAAGKDTKDFYIGGLDNTKEAREKIKAGTALRASLDNIPYDNGTIDVDLCMDLINGKTVDPRYVIETKLVTYEDVMAEDN